MALPNRRLDDVLTRHQVLLQRLSRGEADKFAKFLRQMDRELRMRLSGDELTAFNRDRLEKLLRFVDDLLTEIYGEFTKSVTGHLGNIANEEAAFTGRALEVVADIETVIPSAAQIRASVFTNPLAVRGAGGGELLKDFIADWSRSEIKKVIGAIRAGVFQGKTNAQIVQTIRGTKAKRYADGLLEISNRNARAVVQTAVQHVSSVARQETFKANDDIVVGIQWLATLDSKTCVRCAALDLKEFPMSKGPRPPLHINCRCTTTAVLDKKFEAFNKRSVRPSVGPDGAEQASAGIPYYQWLKQQPAEFQDAAIGPRRGQLLRDGGLSADRFAQLQLDKNFEPMTLEEMKLLEPLAFIEAGLK